MNSLSWLLYIADVGQNIAMMFSIIGTLSILCILILTMIRISNSDRNMTEGFVAMYPKMVKVMGCFVGLMFLAQLFPSEQTVYMIAASESAELVITSETGSEMISDVQAIISAKLDDVLNDINLQKE